MSTFFQGAREFTINGGKFGPDYSRHTTHHGPVHHVNDHSRHTTNYGGYVNHGQHASEGGQITNLAPQTGNYGPVYGNQQYPGYRENRQRPRSPLPPDISEEFVEPPRPSSRPGHKFRRRSPPQDPSFIRDPPLDNNDLSDDENVPQFPPRRERTPRRPQDEQPEGSVDSLDEEMRNLSPEMQSYIQRLIQQRNKPPRVPARPERDIQDRMANMRIDDPETVRPASGQRNLRSRPRNPPGGTRGAPSKFSYRKTSTGDDSESDEGGWISRDDHTIIENIDSQNVNNTTVVDSHNDNSTRTEISKVR